ncbi:MAG: hypothetical protein GC190_14340 [Alphaproteobacteria bacterium]|nr:hypothetical protein [Alphaproteobacteria bacterium]
MSLRNGKSFVTILGGIKFGAVVQGVMTVESAGVAPVYRPCPLSGRDWRFVARTLNNDLTNFAMLANRDFLGFIVTAKNSGTHWVNYALNVALAKQYEVPEPRYSDNPSTDDIIGHPKHKRLYEHVPRVAASHSIPHVAMNWRWLRSVAPFPKYVVIIRDLRDALASFYVKWRGEYGVSFDEFLRGDPLGRRFRADIWWYIHFLNRWGDVGVRFPGDVLFVKYEDLLEAPQSGLLAISDHLRMGLSKDSIEFAVQSSSKEVMMKRRDPNNPQTVIRLDGESDRPSFGPNELAEFRRIIGPHLKYDFGYDYWADLEDAPRASVRAPSHAN